MNLTALTLCNAEEVIHSHRCLLCDWGIRMRTQKRKLCCQDTQTWSVNTCLVRTQSRKMHLLSIVSVKCLCLICTHTCTHMHTHTHTLKQTHTHSQSPIYEHTLFWECVHKSKKFTLCTIGYRVLYCNKFIILFIQIHKNTKNKTFKILQNSILKSTIVQWNSWCICICIFECSQLEDLYVGGLLYLTMVIVECQSTQNMY